jgi:hypothetical protein
MTDKEGKIPPPLSEEQLRRLILEAIDDAADWDNPETFHARFGHLDRGLQTDDILHGLEEDWQFDRPPVFNEFHWQWKYYIDTENTDGTPILIIVAVDSLDRSFEVITRWRKR